MKETYIKLLKRMRTRNVKQLTIPEIGLRLNVDSFEEFAMMIRTYVDSDCLDEITLELHGLNKEQVKRASQMVRFVTNENIQTIVLMGEHKNIVYDEFQRKYGEKVIINQYLKPIHNSEHVLFHVTEESLDSNIIKAISSQDVTAAIINNHMVRFYVDGKSERLDILTLPALETYLFTSGFFPNELLMGILINELDKIDCKHSKTILNHLNSPFVRSISNLVSEDCVSIFHFANETDLKTITKILDTLPFERIKNYEYAFVKAFFL